MGSDGSGANSTEYNDRPLNTADNKFIAVSYVEETK